MEFLQSVLNPSTPINHSSRKKNAGTPTNWHHSGLQSPYKQFSEDDTKQKIAKSPEMEFETEGGKEYWEATAVFLKKRKETLEEELGKIERDLIHAEK